MHVSSVGHSDTHHAADGQKIVDPIRGSMQPWIARDAELLLVPRMDSSLIANVELAPKIRKDLGCSFIDILFRLGRRIGLVEVENVVVFDSAHRVLIGQEIPDRLEKASADEPGIRHIELIQTREDLVYDRVELNKLQELYVSADSATPASSSPFDPAA
jgi:hypothetical protein